MDIVIHKPAGSQHKQTLRLVDSFEIEFGEENKVHVTYKDGSTDTYEGIGYTVSAASLTVAEGGN